MKTHIIIHGHFYQPPRENPWTGIIPQQESAAPFKNWNERILAECYQANSASRYLDETGKIVGINNNYEKMSFNFGPTLINWIKEHHPDVYKKIQDADRESVKEYNGHGNAIAQVYNHIIMPLADEKDKRTQIEWGIADFESHFHRKPEGMWLAETGIDYKTVDLLIEYGIKFVILSPWQCQSTCEENSNRWKVTDNPQEVTGKPYKIQGENGYIAVFFYDHILAQGISFEHYLRNADTLFSLLQNQAKSNKSKLIHTATDGEIYGHHEPYGDMCFSALIEKVKGSDELIFDNYGNFIAEHPPVDEARIKLGEKNLGSSWSCSHGVSRWYKNCGCNTGNQPGWNQKWRKPLRDSFDFLNLKLRALFDKEMREFTNSDPEIIWNQFIDVLTGKIKRIAYAQKFDIPNEKITPFFELLESRKYSIYMYTSCGWFFSELSGIEPVQNICYAMRALELINNHENGTLLSDFLKCLSKAKSNIYTKKTGREIALDAEKLHKHNEFQIVAASLAKMITSINPEDNFIPPKNKKAIINFPLENFFGQFYLKNIELKYPFDKNYGTIHFQQWQLQKDYTMEYALIEKEGGSFLFRFTTTDEKERKTVDLPSSDVKISNDLKDKLLLSLLSKWNDTDQYFNRFVLFINELSQDSKENNNEFKKFYYNLINLRIAKMLETSTNDPLSIFETLKEISILTSVLYDEEKNNFHDSLLPLFSTLLYSEVKKVTQNDSLKQRTVNVIELLKIIYETKIDCEISTAQGLAYEFYLKLKNNQTLFKVPPQKESLDLMFNYLNINTGV